MYMYCASQGRGRGRPVWDELPGPASLPQGGEARTQAGRVKGESHAHPALVAGRLRLGGGGGEEGGALVGGAAGEEGPLRGGAERRERGMA